MSNLTDKDIDHLSREAAEMFEPDDTILSWNRLEHALSNTIPDKPPGFWSLYNLRPFLYGSMIVLVSGITYLLIKTRQHKTFSTQPVTNTLSVIKDQPVAGRGSGDDVENRPVQNAETGSSAIVALSKADNALSVNRAEAGINRPVETSALSQHPNSSGPYVLKTYGQRNFKKQKNHQQQTIDGSDNISSEDLFTNTDPADKTIDNKLNGPVSSAGVSVKSRQHGSLPDIFRKTPFPIIVSGNDSSLLRFSAAAGDATRLQRRLQVKRPLSIGLVMGPDLSEVGGLAPDVLSNNMGISLGYHLTNRLSLNSGILFTKKNYWTTGKDFKAPYIPMAAILHLDFVNGNCNMIEIPLTIRYDFPVSKTATFFVNGGASSYLMRKESYTYYYSRGLEWKGENSQHQNYLFSVISISAGAEKDLGKGFSFQAEPFLRIPTTGIGYGKVQLNSYGMLFSLRYAPVLGRSKK